MWLFTPIKKWSRRRNVDFNRIGGRCAIEDVWCDSVSFAFTLDICGFQIKTARSKLRLQLTSVVIFFKLIYWSFGLKTRLKMSKLASPNFPDTKVTIKNKEIFNLQLYKAKKSSKSSHLRSWKKKMLAFFFCLMNNLWQLINNQIKVFPRKLL